MLLKTATGADGFLDSQNYINNNKFDNQKYLEDFKKYKKSPKGLFKMDANTNRGLNENNSAFWDENKRKIDRIVDYKHLNEGQF